MINFSEKDFLEIEKKRKKNKSESEQEKVNPVDISIEENTTKTPVINESKNDVLKSLEAKINNFSLKNDEKTLKNDEKLKNIELNLGSSKFQDAKEIKKDSGENTEIGNDNSQIFEDKKLDKDEQSDMSSFKKAGRTFVPKDNESTDDIDCKNDKNKEEYANFQSEIDKIDSKYYIKPPELNRVDEQLNLKRKEYIDKSDEQIKKEVEDELFDYAKTQKESIDNRIDNKISTLNEKESNLRAKSELDKVQLQNYYNSYRKRAENDAIKRGIQRSSIVINNLNAFDNDLIEKLIKIDQQLGENIANIHDEIETLNEEKQKAIDDFKISYAVKINNRIKELKEKMQQKNDEILEYNNKITQIEAEYKSKAQKQNKQLDADYKALLDKYNEDTEVANEKKYNEYISAIENYLASLPKEDAMAELSNNSFIKEILGNSLYYYIYKTSNRWGVKCGKKSYN